jgi:hypothetical protein
MKQEVEIYEVNYAVSPGGVDVWAVEAPSTISDALSRYEEGFKTAGEALDFALKQFPAQELQVTVKSLEWYFKQQEEK